MADRISQIAAAVPILQSGRQVQMDLVVLRREAGRLTILRDGAVDVALPQQRLRQVVMRFGVCGPQANRRPEPSDRFRNPASGEIPHTQQVMPTCVGGMRVDTLFGDDQILPELVLAERRRQDGLIGSVVR